LSELRTRLKRLRSDPVLQNTAYLVANSASLAAFGFAFWIFAARRFSPEEVGVATALISTTQLVTLLASAGMSFAILRQLPRADRAERDRLVNSALAFTALFGLVAGVLAGLASRLMIPALAESLATAGFVAAFAGLVAFQTLSGVVDAVFTAVQRSSLVFWKNNVGNVLKIGLVALLPVSLGATGVFAANSVPFVLTVVASLLVAFAWILKGYRVMTAPALKTAAGLMGFGLVAHVAHLLFMAPQLVLPLIALEALGAAETAYLYTSWKLAGLMWVVTTAASGPLLAFGSANPLLYPAKARRTLAVSVGLTLGLSIVGLVAAPFALALFGGDYAAKSASLVAYLLFSSIPLGIFAIYQASLRVYARTTELVAASAAFAALTFAAFLWVTVSPTLEGYGMGWLAATGVAGLVATWRLFGPDAILDAGIAQAPASAGAED